MSCSCGRKVHSSGLCSTCYNREWRKKTLTPKTKTECLADDCSNLHISKWGYCGTHANKGIWAAEKQAKQEWFERQPEENITDAVIRYALTNDIALKLFTNTETQGDCLVWKGAVSSNGYGQIGIRVKFGEGLGTYFSHPVLTHRLAYATKDDLPASQSGPRADTLTINHICENKVCVNPSHLEVLTQADNARYSHPASVEGTCFCGATFWGHPQKMYCDSKCKWKYRDKPKRERMK